MAGSDPSVLVIGATGFAGGAVTRELRRRGHPVRALVRPTADAAGLAGIGVEPVTGDVTDPAAVRRAAEGMDWVINFASPFRLAKASDRYLWDVNVGGVENVLAAARHHGTGRVIHCSTIGVHGDVKEIPSHEGSPFNPGDVYQETKLIGEERVREAIRAGLPAVVVRPASLYGPGDTRMLKLFRSIQRGSFCMVGSGEALFHPLYIDDAVEGFLLAARSPFALGQVYILAGPRAVTLNELTARVADAVGAPRPRRRVPLWPVMAAARVCERVCRPLGIEPPLHVRRVRFFVNNRSFTAEKARHELGFVPRVDLPDGLRRTAEWYRALGLLRPDGATRSRSIPTPTLSGRP